MVFHENRHFLQLLAKKLIKRQKRASFFEKLQVLAKSIIFHGVSRNEALFAENLIKTQKHASLFEKFQVLAKSMIFHGFSRNEALSATFFGKVHQNRKTCQFVRKVECFGQIDDFSCFFRK